MAQRWRNENRFGLDIEEPRRAFRSGYDEDRDFERTARAPFREYGRAGGRESRRDTVLESGSRMHFEGDRAGEYGEAPRYEYGRYGGRQPRSDYEFGGGGFQRFDSGGSPSGYGRESMRGRGPKGYARSDTRIFEDICDELTEDPILDASEIDVKVSNGEVTLSGTVESRAEKRRAEDDADSIPGVNFVQNNLRIEEPLNLTREVGTTSGTAGGNVTGTVAGTTEPASRESETA